MKSKKEQRAFPLVIGAQIDRTLTTVALVDGQGHVIVRERAETPQRTTRSAVSSLTKMILDLTTDAGRGGRKIEAIGLAVPGLVDPSSRRVTIEGMSGWNRIPLAEMVEERLSESTPKPVIVNNSIACLAAAEAWQGRAQDRTNLVYLSIGERIETGIMIDGKVLSGAGGLAGSAGWLGLSENFKPEYGNRGCLAHEASTSALTRRAIEEWSGSGSSILGKLIKSDVGQLNAETIFRAARGGDDLALKVVSEANRWLGRGIANLISILNPEMVLLGGSLGSRMRPFLDDLREESSRWTHPHAAKQCRIVISTIGEEDACIGAARLAGN